MSIKFDFKRFKTFIPYTEALYSLSVCRFQHIHLSLSAYMSNPSWKQNYEVKIYII